MNGVLEKQSEPATLFDMSSMEVQVKLPNENKILFIPLRPIHHKALKLQNLIETMERQAERNGAQFNSRNYLDALNAFSDCAELIREEITDELSDQGGMVATRGEGAAPPVGDGNAVSVGVRVSADNPTAR